MSKLVEILPDKTALIERSLNLITDQITTALATQDRFTLALAGGSTPKPLYEALSQKALPWHKIDVFWSDERYVAPDHADSNEGMARRAWLNHVPMSSTQIHPVPTQSADPEKDATAYEAEIRRVFNCPSPAIPAFDLILLGMGDDGHTASLFPQTEALKVKDRLIAVGSKGGEPRLTFTFPLINQAHRVIFLVSGENKRPALAAIFAPEGDGNEYPSRFVCPQGQLWWLLDQAAGGALTPLSH